MSQQQHQLPVGKVRVTNLIFYLYRFELVSNDTGLLEYPNESREFSFDRLENLGPLSKLGHEIKPS